MVYRGEEGLTLKIPFSNLHTKGFSPNGISFSGVKKEDSTDFAVLTE